MRPTLEFYETLEEIIVLGIPLIINSSMSNEEQKYFLVVDCYRKEVRRWKSLSFMCLRAGFRQQIEFIKYPTNYDRFEKLL